MKVISACLLIMLSILVLPGICAGEELDLLQRAIDHKASAPPDQQRLGDMLHSHRQGFLWRTPPGTPSSQVVLDPIEVKPATHYTLRWKVEPAQTLKIMMFATFYDEAGDAGPRVHLVSFENSSAYWTLEKKIITPANARRMDITFALGGIKISEEMNVGFMSELRLREDGPIPYDPALAEHYGKNLLPIGDFSSYPVGETDRAALHLMPFGQKPFGTEVVSDGDGKALRIHYRPGDYQYAAWFTPELPLYGQAGWLKCRIRGKGRVQMMVWWNRPAIHSIYKHFGFFDLTSEYQNIVIAIGCDDPLARKAAVAVACRDTEAEFEIAEIGFYLHQPKGGASQP